MSVFGVENRDTLTHKATGVMLFIFPVAMFSLRISKKINLIFFNM